MISKKSLSSFSSRNVTLMFDSKSFHRRQNFSADPILGLLRWEREEVTKSVIATPNLKTNDDKISSALVER